MMEGIPAHTIINRQKSRFETLAACIRVWYWGGVGLANCEALTTSPARLEAIMASDSSLCGISKV